MNMHIQIGAQYWAGRQQEKQHYLKTVIQQATVNASVCRKA
jgi:hypothetical protein